MPFDAGAGHAARGPAELGDRDLVGEQAADEVGGLTAASLASSAAAPLAPSSTR